MNKFFLITKINLLSFFNLKRVTGSKFKSERKKNIAKALVFLIAILYLSWYIYMMVDMIMPSFVMIGKPIYVLAMLFTLASMFIFITNIVKIKSILFDFKDYDLLFSLPLKRETIIISKLTSLYLLNLVYTLIFMVPGFIAYVKYVPSNFGILYFILTLFIPIVPIILSSIIGIIISWLTSFFKNKNIGSYIVNLGLVLLVLYFSFQIEKIDPDILANNSIGMIDRFGGIYPLTNLFVRLINRFTFIDFLLYISIPLVLIILFTILINRFYVKVRTRLLKSNIKNDYKIKEYQKSSSLFSLYKKEIRKLFSNSLYSINSLFGCLIIIIMIVALLLFNENILGRFLAIPDFGDTLKTQVFFLLSLFCTLSCTTNSSISLEGKSLWILKSLPVNSDTIVLAKMMVNLTFLVPTIFIAATFFSFYLHLNTIEIIFLYLMPLAYAYFTTCFGIILNLWFPRFDFDNEIKVIKQSMAVFLSIIIGMLSVMIPMIIGDITINYLLLITSIMFFIDIALSIYLHYYAKYRIRKL